MTDHHHAVFVQQPRFKGRQHVVLALKYHRRRFNHLVLHRDRRSFHHRASQVAAQHLGAAVAGEWFFKGRDDLVVQWRCRPFAPVQLAVIQPWLQGVARQAKAGHGVNILMQQAAFQQLAHQYRNAACRLEVVDIRRAVGIEARQQRHHV